MLYELKISVQLMVYSNPIKEQKLIKGITKANVEYIGLGNIY